MKLPKACSMYGAQMGRTNVLPDNRRAPCRLQMRRLRWVDGDYDQGGAYWGGGLGDWIYHTWGDAGDVVARVYVRARSRAAAKAEVRALLPAARFFGGGR